MYCGKCGRKLEEGDVFCPQCGTRRMDSPMEANIELMDKEQAENMPKKGKMASAIAAVLAVCVIVAGIFAGFKFWDVNQGNADKTIAENRNSAGETIQAETLPENCTVEISQYDISDYPTVKVYLEVFGEDGTLVENLDKENFCVKERRGSDGKAEEKATKNVVKLNENEGISIGLIADASGSMEADIAQVKTEMLEFLKTVQFDKGDEVELVKFSDESYICASFTNDMDYITEAVNSMTTDGNTRLYDTLMNELVRIQSQKNAKSIIAFTDGWDNESVYMAEEVAEYAVECRIPIFLIGIGSECDEETLAWLAEETGGSYQNIDDIGLLEDNYRSIYQEEKEVYLLEYEIDEADDFDNGCYLEIALRDEEGNAGGEAEFSFEPSDFFEMMYNRFLIAGIDCQTKGERNLLDSGLIVTTKEAYGNPDCVAYQSQEAINSGGTGASGSNVYVVLMDHEVLNVYKNTDGSYTVYGVSNYDISKINRYGELRNEQEKLAVSSIYGESSREKAQYRIEENRSNYEKLTLVKDTDGKWKFNTRVYEREDGGNPYPVNEIYDVTLY